MKLLWAPLLATVAVGQQVDLSVLDKLASRAKSSVNVTLDEDKLGLLLHFYRPMIRNRRAQRRSSVT